MPRAVRRVGALAAFVLCAGIARAEPVTSITQYGITWTFDGEYESGQFASGDYWVVGPVEIESVSPAPTGTRNVAATQNILEPAGCNCTSRNH